MVIFGAGASYDSLASRPLGGSLKDREEWRPPCADNLFAPLPHYEEIARRLPQMSAIVPLLQRRQPNKTVEDVLSELEEDARSYSPGLRQLVAVRFYLQALIHGCESLWNGSTIALPSNHETLLDQIDRERPPGQRVVLVTFNYDRMIESALERRGRRFSSLDDYQTGEHYLFKLHGSVDWARPLTRQRSEGLSLDRWITARELCNSATDLTELGDIVFEKQVPSSRVDTRMAIPALSVPLRQKSAYECRENHIQLLRLMLRDVRGVLTIGWRGGEQHFLNDLQLHLRKDVQWMCVSGSEDLSGKTLLALQAARLQGEWNLFDGGFTDLVTSPRLRSFLRAVQATMR